MEVRPQQVRGLSCYLWRLGANKCGDYHVIIGALCCADSRNLGAAAIYWAHLSSLHLKAEAEYSIRIVMFINKKKGLRIISKIVIILAVYHRQKGTGPLLHIAWNSGDLRLFRKVSHWNYK
jgi:hypothetical protein